MAKLHPRITTGMTADEFPDVLVEQDVTSSTSDFIEVHIYGALTGSTVKRVIGNKPRSKADKQIWKRVKTVLRDLGAEIEES